MNAITAIAVVAVVDFHIGLQYRADGAADLAHAIAVRSGFSTLGTVD
ncbi:MAG: hypothetical protein RID22_22715 [Roseibium aggregatum]